MRSGRLLCGFLAVGVVAVVLIVASNARSSREARLRKIEEVRSLRAVVARHEKSPVVQGISKVMRTNLEDHLKNRVKAQERMASKAGDLVSVTIWAPGLHSMSAQMKFSPKPRINSAHFVAWQFSGDDLMTGYVRPEEIGIWQAELCTITNSFMWSERGVFKLVGGAADCLLPDGSQVRSDQLAKWLDDSIEQGWCVGVSLVQNGNNLLVGTRKRITTEAQQGAAPNERQ
jgi:hypothetical protein